MPDKRYYSLVKEGNVADITIYGDITSWPWSESDVSSYNLSKELDALTDVDHINVNINSYGGEVAEGLAIYNALRRHKAHVRTVCDGFACSIASVIFMAGDERIVNDASLIMIHNAWSYAHGNAADLRKQADDLDIITSASKQAYMSRIAISEEELTELMDGETWIKPEDALRMGFATEVRTYQSNNPSQSARSALFRLISQAIDDEDEPGDDGADGDDPDAGGSGDQDDQDGNPDGSPDGDDADGGGEGGDADDPDEDPDENENQSKEAAALAAFILSEQAKF